LDTRAREEADELERIVTAACELVVVSPVVRAVHVLTGHRSTYPELLRFRDLAQARDLTMTVLGTEGIILRSRRIDRQTF